MKLTLALNFISQATVSYLFLLTTISKMVVNYRDHNKFQSSSNPGCQLFHWYVVLASDE